MRNLTTILFLLFSFVVFSGNLSAQTFSRATTTQTANVTPYTLTIDGKTFKGGVSAKGAIYINRVSAKSGKEYKQYLGYTTSHTFEGQPVLSDKAGTTFHILELGRTGYPKKVALIAN